MEPSIKSISLLVTILLTGLSSGLFYGWEVSVIPGTKKISLGNYLETMQMINRAIINPAFLVVFIGPVVSQALVTYQFRTTALFGWLLAAMLAYLIGTFGVTALGNVPLNDTLDAVVLNDISEQKATSVRQSYEAPWNRLHRWRTLFAVLSFTLLLVAAVIVEKN